VQHVLQQICNKPNKWSLGLMLWLRVKCNYFKIILAFINVRLR